MKQTNAAAKKVIIIYILNVLKRFSSAENLITQSAICNYLNDIDIPCERKTVGRNIEYLYEFGYPIKKAGKKGYYIDENDLKNSKNILVI